jgi:hypothetical protein
VRRARNGADQPLEDLYEFAAEFPDVRTEASWIDRT